MTLRTLLLRALYLPLHPQPHRVTPNTTAMRRSYNKSKLHPASWLDIARTACLSCILCFSGSFCWSLQCYAGPLPNLGDTSAMVLSPSQEQVVGQFYMQAMAQQLPLIDDPLALTYIQAIGDRLASFSQRQDQNFYFFLVNHNDINAFAGPGGYIGVNRGLILATKNVSQLAAVMAHEMAHVTQRHIARGIEQRKAHSLPLMLGAAAAIALGASGQTDAAEAAITDGMAASSNNAIHFSQQEEQEADQVGLRTLYHAGYNPVAMVQFFQILQQSQQDYSPHRFNFSDHPTIQRRIAQTENRIRQLKSHPQYTAFTTTTFPSQAWLHATEQDYQLLKIRLKQCYQPYIANSDPAWLQPALQRAQQLQRSLREHIFWHGKQHATPTSAQNTWHTALQNYGYALQLQHTGHHASALVLATELVRNRPSQLAFQLLYNKLLLQTHHNHQALQQLQQLYQIYPDFYPLVICYVQALLQLQKNTAAENILEQQMMQHPKQGIWSQLMAQIASRKQQFQAAELYAAQANLLDMQPQIAQLQLQQLLQQPTTSKNIASQAKALLQRAQQKTAWIKAVLP